MMTNMRQKMSKLQRISKMKINKINKDNTQDKNNEIKMNNLMYNYKQVQEDRNNLMM